MRCKKQKQKIPETDLGLHHTSKMELLVCSHLKRCFKSS